MAFIGLKGIFKIYYKQQQFLRQAHRQIKNYESSHQPITTITTTATTSSSSSINNNNNPTLPLQNIQNSIHLQALHPNGGRTTSNSTQTNSNPNQQQQQQQFRAHASQRSIVRNSSLSELRGGGDDESSVASSFASSNSSSQSNVAPVTASLVDTYESSSLNDYLLNETILANTVNNSDDGPVGASTTTAEESSRGRREAAN